ncbi:glutamine amidotransferase [Pseudahrensia aquimaris]|uniref:Glutamine amidotransferase n=1 Tax=Pseudahrensia aquimaris TaxID=744461 RepID=A0ABW3FEJ0_9HYPH
MSVETRPILIILHQETSTPGRVGQRLVERGFSLDIRRPPLGDHLPESLDDHAGAIMFGGPMSANDPDEFVKRETDWLAVPLKEERPLLGICLGAQKLVKHLGGAVEAHPEGLVEVGYYPLEPTQQGREFMEHWPEHIYQWHREGFDLPRGATLLARGDVYPNQMFAYGKHAYALQFHTELTLAMMLRWTVKGAERMVLPGAQNRKQHIEGRMVHDAAISAWLDQFLDKFIGTAANPAEVNRDELIAAKVA